MRAVVQRAAEARVTVDGRVAGEIGPGLLLLLGVQAGDTEADAVWMLDKVAGLRIFDDEAGQMNRSLADVSGALLVVSQFTLLGDCRKGRRPSWHEAAPPDAARVLYEHFLALCRARGIPTQSGEFQAMMRVALVNDGPVTVLLDSRKLF